MTITVSAAWIELAAWTLACVVIQNFRVTLAKQRPGYDSLWGRPDWTDVCAVWFFGLFPLAVINGPGPIW